MFIFNAIFAFAVGLAVVLLGYVLCTMVGAVSYCVLKKHNKLNLVYPNMAIGESVSMLGFWVVLTTGVLGTAIWFIGRGVISAF